MATKTNKTTKKTVEEKKPTVKKPAKKVVKEEKSVAPVLEKKKAVAPKKTSVKKVAVEKKQSVKTAAVKTVAKVQPVEQVKPQQTKDEDFGRTKLSRSLFVTMTVILWAILTAWVIIEVNYEVTIEHKDVIARRIERRMVNMQKQKAKKLEAAAARKKAAVVSARKAAIKAAKQMPKKVSRPPLKLAERKAAFIESEYAPYAGEGKAVIEGNVCFELSDGTKKCFENVDVFINPVTTYSDEWYNRGWAGNEFLEKADARAIPYNKMIKTGKDGAFKFEALQPGSYYVGTMLCLPQAAEDKRCSCTRFASKVTMKNRVKTTLKQVYPVKQAK